MQHTRLGFQQQAQQEQTAWESANSSASEASYQSYLNQYPRGKYAALASGQAWQDKELLSQEANSVSALKAKGMTVIEPDVELWRKPVLDTVPKKFEDKWGKGVFESLLAL